MTVEEIEDRVGRIEQRVTAIEELLGIPQEPDPDLPPPEPEPEPDPPPPPVFPESFVTPTDVIPNFAAHPTVWSVRSGTWDDHSLWSTNRVPGDEDVVVISDGHTVECVDIETGSMASLGVFGRLVVSGTTDSSLTTITVGTVVIAPNGECVVGGLETPVLGRVQFVVAGRALATTTPDAVTGVVDPEQFGSGMIVLGSIKMYGASLREPFVRMSEESDANTSTLTVVGDVTGWKSGDRIVVPDTRQLTVDTNDPYEPQWEERRIDTINGQRITLDAPLAYRHGGARAADGTLDYLPHVANLTRSIEIRSTDASIVRGHVLFGHHADVDIRYVAFRGLGRTREAPIDNTVIDQSGQPSHIGTNQIARYPLHFHHVMGRSHHDDPDFHGHQFHCVGNVIDGGSERHDLKWGLVVHGSHFGHVADNVLYNAAAGAGLVTEDGSESQNLIEHNYVVRVQSTNARHPQPMGKNEREDGRGGHGIWCKGPLNVIRRNVVSNVSHCGISVFGRSYVTVPDAPGAMPTTQVFLRHKGFIEFSGNEVYGATDRALDLWYMGERWGPYGSDQAEDVVVSNTHVWHVHHSGFGPYYLQHVVIDGWTQRGDPAALSTRDDLFHAHVGLGIYGASSVKVFVKNADIQNMRIGVYVRGRGMFDEVDVEHSTLRNKTNFAMLPFADNPPSGEVVCRLRDSRLEPLLSNSKMVEMVWVPPSNKAVLIPQSVYLERINGSPDIFRVYWREQAPDAPLGFRNPSSVPLDVHPEPTLTNQESWDRYQQATAGAVAACLQERPDVVGYVCQV